MELQYMDYHETSIPYVEFTAIFKDGTRMTGLKAFPDYWLDHIMIDGVYVSEYAREWDTAFYCAIKTPHDAAMTHMKDWEVIAALMSVDENFQAVTFEDEDSILVKMAGTTQLLCTVSGFTYLCDDDGNIIEGEDPVHIHDIEEPDWFLCITDEDWARIQKAVPNFEGYTKEDIQNAMYARVYLHQIVARKDAKPDGTCFILDFSGEYQHLIWWSGNPINVNEHVFAKDLSKTG